VTRKKRIIILVTTILCGALALTAVRAHDVPRVATGFVAHTLCSAAFVSGVDPDEVYAETMEAMPGVGLIAWALSYNVDREAKQVTATLFGGGQSRAVYREGLGVTSSRARPMSRCRQREASRNAHCCRDRRTCAGRARQSGPQARARSRLRGA